MRTPRPGCVDCRHDPRTARRGSGRFAGKEHAGRRRSTRRNLVLVLDVPQTSALLVQAGITQLAAVGSASSRFLGLPHEGEFSLRRLIRVVGVDLGAGSLTFPGRTGNHSADVSAALVAAQ